MRIVRIVSELDFGGVEQVLANSIPTMTQNGQVELSVLVLGKGGKIAEQLINKGFSIQILNSNPRIPNILLIPKVSRILYRLSPEVVHTQGGEANFHGILAAKLARIPKIIGEEIGIPNHHSYWKWVFRYVYKRASQVIAISEAVKKNIVELGEVNPEKVIVIYNPVVCGKRSVENSVSKKSIDFVFVTTCRLVPVKNLKRLIHAFGGLVKVNPDRKLRLRIIGNGPDRESIQKEIRKMGLEKKVEILGFQSNIWPFLEESNVFVLPSLREGSSVALAEAMTAGLPSIVTQVGGASEILGNSNSGILINPFNTSEIQHGLQSILDLSEDMRKEMGLRAQNEAKRFSVDSYIQSLLSVYNDL